MRGRGRGKAVGGEILCTAGSRSLRKKVLDVAEGDGGFFFDA